MTPTMQPASAESSTSNYTKYPQDSAVEKLSSTLEIKEWWLFNEWDSRTIRKRDMIRNDFPLRKSLDPRINTQNEDTAIERVKSVFHSVRGQYILWGPLREQGKWRKVVVPHLCLQWVKDNVEVLYPAEDRFPLASLDGIVLWKDPTKEKYQLFEGNHRISTWLSEEKPATLPSIIFIGKTPKNLNL